MNTDQAISLLHVLDGYFKLKSTGPGLHRISFGAQFSREANILAWCVTIFLLFVVGVSLFLGNYIISFLCVALAVPIIGYVLDIQGLEWNTNSHHVRAYESFLGYRTGTWMDLSDFDSLVIVQDGLMEERVLDKGTSYSSSRSFDTHRFYTLCLLHKNRRTQIKLLENESITRIRQAAEAMASKTDLKLHDKIIRGELDVVKHTFL